MSTSCLGVFGPYLFGWEKLGFWDRYGLKPLLTSSLVCNLLSGGIEIHCSSQGLDTHILHLLLLVQQLHDKCLWSKILGTVSCWLFGHSFHRTLWGRWILSRCWQRLQWGSSNNHRLPVVSGLFNFLSGFTCQARQFTFTKTSTHQNYPQLLKKKNEKKGNETKWQITPQNHMIVATLCPTCKNIQASWQLKLFFVV